MKKNCHCSVQVCSVSTKILVFGFFESLKQSRVVGTTLMFAMPSLVRLDSVDIVDHRIFVLVFLWYVGRFGSADGGEFDAWKSCKLHPQQQNQCMSNLFHTYSKIHRAYLCWLWSIKSEFMSSCLSSFSRLRDCLDGMAMTEWKDMFVCWTCITRMENIYFDRLYNLTKTSYLRAQCFKRSSLQPDVC